MKNYYDKVIGLFGMSLWTFLVFRKITRTTRISLLSFNELYNSWENPEMTLSSRYVDSDESVKANLSFPGESDVYMWNTETWAKSDNFLLVQKANDCRLPTQVVPGHKRLMWVIESNFQDYIQNTVSCPGATVAIHPLVKSCDD